MKEFDIKSKTLSEIENLMSEKNLPVYRAKQLFDWLQNKGVMSYDEMVNIPKSIRNLLIVDYPVNSCVIKLKRESKLDETVKYLIQLSDGNYVETVLMKYKYGYSICVSSQVGCKMGCYFCASTKSGCIRSLLPSEIIGQIHAVQNEKGIRISHVVMMGMGEPLDNFQNTLRFLELINSAEGLNISLRNVSLSTCGLVDKIDLLSELNLQITLSISLHAPNNDIRNKMMPVNKKFPIEKLISSCKNYTEATSRRISFEYALISGVNDSPECAYELSRLLKRMLCHVNLIPVNEIKETDYVKSRNDAIERFKNILIKNGINTTVRRTLGSDIEASCGQLRNKYLNETEELI